MAPNGDENTPSTDDNISLTQVNQVDFTPFVNHRHTGCVCFLQVIFVVHCCAMSDVGDCTQMPNKPCSNSVVLLIHWQPSRLNSCTVGTKLFFIISFYYIIVIKFCLKVNIGHNEPFSCNCIRLILIFPIYFNNNNNNKIYQMKLLFNFNPFFSLYPICLFQFSLNECTIRLRKSSRTQWIYQQQS